MAEVIIKEVVSRFGTPETIYTDQGRVFEAQVFRELLSRMGIHKTRTTPYHPQSDGMVERFNRTLESLLTITIRENQEDWDLKAPWVTSASGLHHTRRQVLLPIS